VEKAYFYEAPSFFECSASVNTAYFMPDYFFNGPVPLTQPVA